MFRREHRPPPRWGVALIAVAWVLLGSLHAEVVIAEFLAENDDGIEDVDGDNSDWIELHNNGAGTVDLAGWRLTDDVQAPAKWQFPTVILTAGQRLVVFASGKDRRVAGQELHTSFSLENAGEYLALSKPDGTITSVFNLYPAQRGDISYGDGTIVDAQDLIVATSAGKYHVPTSAVLGTSWTQPAFNDAGWAAATSRVGYQTGGPRPGLPISYWTFNDTTANAIAGGPDATLIGAAYNASVPGAIGEGKSLHFTRASNTYVSAALDVSETAFTSSFWFRTTQATTGMFTIVSADLGGGGHDRHVYLSGGNIFARTWNNEVIGSTGRNYADGQWHHAAHVVGLAANGQRIYVDGIQVATGVKAQSDFNWQARVNIGFSNDAGGGAHHEGEIDDVAIWSEVLNAASIASLASGTPPDGLPGFGPYISTNVEGPLRNVSSSLYLRLPFTVNRATPFNSAALRVRYDDGFAAYLDGTLIATRNAPAGLAYNSTATQDRPVDDALVLESIDLTAQVGLLANGNHILAIHALNDSSSSPEFLINAELSGATLTPSSGVYFDPPTPGTPNTTGFAGFVADTVFTPKRGFYATAQNVTITSATLGATLAYTLDGSDPSPTNGTQVPASNATTPPSVSLAVSSTKYIRAMAYKSGSGLRVTNADTHTYIFTAQVLTQSNTQPGYPASWAGRAADYGMDANVVNTTLPGYSVPEALASLPSVSMTCPINDLFGAPSGIYYDSQLRGLGAERKVSIEWINPGGTPGWHVQCGTRLHGNSSRSHGFIPKHPMRLIFRGEYGTGKLREDIFGGGVEKFDQLLLRGCSTDSFPVVDGNIEDGEQRWNNDKATYLRDQYMRDLLNELGHPNARGRYVHLFINGLYWGLYNIAERPTASFFADTFGGAEEEWDVVKDFQELHDGTINSWNEMMAIVGDGSITDAVRCQKLIGNNPDGTRNPAYPIYVHWPSLRDYMVAHIAAGAEDWPDHDYWAGRRRGALSEGFRFVAWDQEISNDSLTRQSGRGSDNPFEAVDEPGPAILYDKFRRAEPFKTEFRERVHALLFNGGALTPAMQKARWAVRQAQIDKAIVGESARWGDANGEGAKKRETTWLNNMSYMNTAGTGYWDAIHPIDVQRFRNVQLYPSINQPGFSHQGGTVPAGFQLFLNHTEPLIYYTLNGSDPRGPNGAPAPSALLYNGSTTFENPLPAGASWKYLVTANAPSSTWKNTGFNDTSWATGNAQLGYGDGDETTTIGFGGNPAARYVTTYFRKAFTVTDKATVASARVFLLRDDGAVIYLNGQELGRSNMHPTNVIGYATTALSDVTGADETSQFYEIPINIANLVEGTNLLAVEVHKSSASEDDLSFDARVEVARSGGANGIVLNSSGMVKARARTSGGEWSGANSAYFTIGSQPPSATNVVFSEVHYHPSPPTRSVELAVSSNADDFEFVELMNIGPAAVDFTGAHLADGLEFDFPVGHVLVPGARCVVVRNVSAFESRYGTGRNVAGAFTGGTGLGNGGDTLALTLTDAGNVTSTLRSFNYGDDSPWPTAPDGGGPSLVLKAPMTNPDHNIVANWIASADRGGTPAQSPEQMTFAAWRTAYGDSLAAAGDEDGDGLRNDLEYALALNPLLRNANVLPAAQVVNVSGQNYVAITFRHRPAADLTTVVETSNTLTGWSPAPSVVLVSSIDHGDGTFTETWRCAAALNPPGNPRQFLRIRTTLTP